MLATRLNSGRPTRATRLERESAEQGPRGMDNRAVADPLVGPDQRAHSHHQEVRQHLGELDEVRMNRIRLLTAFELFVFLDESGPDG